FDDREHAEFNDSLIVVDPVDPNRNVASALSEENFAVFIHACREYLNNPRMEFFFPNDMVPESIENLKEMIKRRGTTLIGISFRTPEALSDILHSQLRKSQKAIVKLCERFDFSLMHSDFFVNDEVMLLFEFDVFLLPSAKLHKGPPVWHRNASDFLNKWTDSTMLIKGPYIMDGHWYVDIQRDYLNARKLIETQLDTLNLGGEINDALKKGYNILADSEMLKKRYALWLTMFLYPKFRWEY
ncbi:MAG: hypothetical protein JSV56_00885, partial [Methanomassiliicoccales archaeon]